MKLQDKRGVFFIFALFKLIIRFLPYILVIILIVFLISKFGLLGQFVFLSKDITLEHYSVSGYDIIGGDKWCYPTDGTQRFHDCGNKRGNQHTYFIFDDRPYEYTDGKFYSIVTTPSHVYEFKNLQGWRECTTQYQCVCVFSCEVYQDGTFLETVASSKETPGQISRSYSELDVIIGKECYAPSRYPTVEEGSGAVNHYTLKIPDNVVDFEVIAPDTEAEEVDIEVKVINNYPYTFKADFTTTFKIGTVLGSLEKVEEKSIQLPSGETSFTFPVSTGAKIKVIPEATLYMSTDDFYNVNVRTAELVGDVRQDNYLEVAHVRGDTVEIDYGKVEVVEVQDSDVDTTVDEVTGKVTETTKSWYEKIFDWVDGIWDKLTGRFR